MSDQLVLQQIDKGVGRLTLNRPEVHNAFDDALIGELTAALLALEADPQVRAVVLAAAGKSFSAGADIAWMQRMAGYSERENLEDARALAGLMSTLDRLAKPTVALVQGAAFGGGVGLVACCDIAIASEAATFSLSEVKLGLIPAVISPYVVAAMGPRAARRFILTAERFSAQQALHHGLVHEVVPADRLEETARHFLDHLAQGGPRAQAAAKDLILSLAGQPISRALVEETAERIARIRVGEEAREGLAAFLEKRKPGWQPE
ncbi:MAG TPA: enoyl-CoA hydratase/isomerase family protein [Kiloniellales bacterium]